MYLKITGIDPYVEPMRIYPAGHYTMGGLWVDYNLQTTIPGLFAIGESNFSDHGANRLGASSLMQCAGDGYFIISLIFPCCHIRIIGIIAFGFSAFGLTFFAEMCSA